MSGRGTFFAAAAALIIALGAAGCAEEIVGAPVFDATTGVPADAAPDAGAGDDAAIPGTDADADAAGDAPGDTTLPPVACAFTPGAAPAVTATTFACATTAMPLPWADCPAQFPTTAAARAVLCGRAFAAAENPATRPPRPDVVLAGNCGGQQVVLLEVLPGRGLECHYDAGGALVGLAFFSEARSFCDRGSAAAAAGTITSAPCLLDMEASWDTVACDEVPACADAGAP